MRSVADGSPDPVTEQVRGADLRARTPQSAIPTQGGPPLPPPRPGPPPMGPRVLGPPSGPARRSPVLTPHGRPTPQHPSGEHEPLHDGGAVPVRARLTAAWTRVREIATTPAGRWSLIGAVALVQVFLLFSTVMWWAGGSSVATASAKLAPMTWTGIVYDVGAAGVNLRSATAIDPANAKDTAARGSRLAVSCGQTGDEVRKGTVHTATWLKTTDGLFVSMLYVRVPDRQSIPSCADSTVDAPLLALADPADPDLPPPPGASLGGRSSSSSGADSAGTARPRVAAAPARSAERGAAAPVAPGAQAMAPAQAPANPAQEPPEIGSGTGEATPTRAPSDGPLTTVTNDYTIEDDPNVTPVG